MDYRDKVFLDFLLSRFRIEREKFDRSGVYAYTQRLLAYNSNKIEGSTLTEEHNPQTGLYHGDNHTTF